MEGEGSFSVQKGKFLLVFSLSQSFRDLPLMEAIKNFIDNLAGKYKSRRNNISVVSLSVSSGVNNSKPAVQIGVTNIDFIINVLIPFFDSLV